MYLSLNIDECHYPYTFILLYIQNRIQILKYMYSTCPYFLALVDIPLSSALKMYTSPFTFSISLSLSVSYPFLFLKLLPYLVILCLIISLMESSIKVEVIMIIIIIIL